jgi:hypothetical protein
MEVWNVTEKLTARNVQKALEKCWEKHKLNNEHNFLRQGLKAYNCGLCRSCYEDIEIIEE